MPRLAVLFVLSAASSPCPDLNLIHYTLTSPTDIFYDGEQGNYSFESYLDLLEFIQEEDVLDGYFYDSLNSNHHLQIIPNYKEFIQILSNFSTILLNELDSEE